MQRVPISEEQASAKEDAEEGGGPEVGRCSCLHVWLLSLARARTLGVWARTCNVSACVACVACGLFPRETSILLVVLGCVVVCDC